MYVYICTCVLHLHCLHTKAFEYYIFEWERYVFQSVLIVVRQADGRVRVAQVEARPARPTVRGIADIWRPTTAALAALRIQHKEGAEFQSQLWYYRSNVSRYDIELIRCALVMSLYSYTRRGSIDSGLMKFKFSVMIRRQNSTTAVELARFQCLFPNPSWLTTGRTSGHQTLFKYSQG